MTPGEEALREAARLEAARIYGRTLREDSSSPAHKFDFVETDGQASAAVDIDAARRRRKGAA